MALSLLKYSFWSILNPERAICMPQSPHLQQSLCSQRAADAMAGLPTDLRIGGVSYPVSQRGETLIRQLELEPSRNQLQVEFAGFNDEPGESLRYSYKLEGGSWSPPLQQRTVNYAALAAGSYRFLVKAVNSEGMESTAPAEIDFQVLPPFWRRWWFEGL